MLSCFLPIWNGAWSMADRKQHRDDNRVLILQSRYHGASSGPEKPSNISHFLGVLNRLHNENFKANLLRSRPIGLR
jgi:hypothetical protein